MRIPFWRVSAFQANRPAAFLFDPYASRSRHMQAGNQVMQGRPPERAMAPPGQVVISSKINLWFTRSLY
jgi:hypothetical protein